MKAVLQPFSDARMSGGRERRWALVCFDDIDVMFTASWERPSSLVPRPDGSYRRKYLVSLLVTAAHRKRAFHQVRAATLYLGSEHQSLSTEDIGDVNARDLHSVTLAMYIDDWRPREPGSGVITKPWRRMTSS